MSTDSNWCYHLRVFFPLSLPSFWPGVLCRLHCVPAVGNLGRACLPRCSNHHALPDKNTGVLERTCSYVPATLWKWAEEVRWTAGEEGRWWQNGWRGQPGDKGNGVTPARCLSESSGGQCNGLKQTVKPKLATQICSCHVYIILLFVLYMYNLLCYSTEHTASLYVYT